VLRETFTPSIRQGETLRFVGASCTFCATTTSTSHRGSKRNGGFAVADTCEYSGGGCLSDDIYCYVCDGLHAQYAGECADIGGESDPETRGEDCASLYVESSVNSILYPNRQDHLNDCVVLMLIRYHRRNILPPTPHSPLRKILRHIPTHPRRRAARLKSPGRRARVDTRFAFVHIPTNHFQRTKPRRQKK
jgi:hypothetical protein